MMRHRKREKGRPKALARRKSSRRLPLDDYDPEAWPTDKYYPGMPIEEAEALGVKPSIQGGFGN